MRPAARFEHAFAPALPAPLEQGLAWRMHFRSGATCHPFRGLRADSRRRLMKPG